MSQAITIKRVLIANRGEIAVRVARTCRRLGIATVAVCSEADRDALHVRQCDQAVCLGPASVGESYLNTQAILDAARKTEADAIHPGYGFLSENADFARAVLDAGLTWIGPGPEAIAAMGSKIEARKLMAAAGVPVVPGTTDPTQALALGMPLLVKASAGGGGRGMRTVRTEADLAGALEEAGREAESSFGSGEVFVERLLEGAKHVEVQVLGDSHGQVVHLFERECSVQRRHQKVVEEAPCAALDETTREALCEAAVQAAEAVNYVGAGTVEFLYAEGAFYFLEMNTRLQVEHPVTEAITGLDLVQLQLEIASGGHVPKTIQRSGAAIEVRLYAEDLDYLPQVGRILDFHLSDPEGLRLDSGVSAGSDVSIHYDAMLAKLISHGKDRDEARRRLLQGLAHLSILGVGTNRDQLMGILSHADFCEGRVHTAWLESVSLVKADPRLLPVARLAALGWELTRPRTLLPGLPLGWRNSPNRPLQLSVSGETLHWTPGSEGWSVRYGDTQVQLSLQRHGELGGTLWVDDWRLPLRVAETPDGWHVHLPLGNVSLVRDPLFADPAREAEAPGCISPMPAKVLALKVAEGDEVEEGQALIVLEAMKMEQTLSADRAGTVAHIAAVVGDMVEAGRLLVEIR